MNQVDILNPKGRWVVKHKRRGVLIGEFDFLNSIPDAAKNALLDTMFNAASQDSTWFIGLIDNASFTGLSASDTMASHAGWNEYTNYSGSRKAWGQGSAAAKSISNASPAQFTFTTSSGVVSGIFINGDSTKGGNITLLWSTALFPALLSVQSGDQLNVTYVLSV